MEPETFQLFFALLTIVANVAAVVLLGLVLLARSSPAASGALSEVRATLGSTGLGLAFAVAGTCMLGSLYFSEVANYVPCTLCWYQRIAMYGLAIVLLAAAVTRDRHVRRYGLTLALVGLPISIYHYLEEWFPSIDSGACSLNGPPCSFVWFRRFGFVSLPYMAASGFLLVVVLLALLPRSQPEAP